jgi:hypothetical protein
MSDFLRVAVAGGFIAARAQPVVAAAQFQAGYWKLGFTFSHNSCSDRIIICGGI